MKQSKKLPIERDTKTPKRLHVLAVRVDDEMLNELRAIAETELRPVANLVALLMKEALDARRKRAAG
jgi:hypothetical protein